MLTGTGLLWRLILRRDRIRAPAWCLGIGLFACYLVVAVQSLVDSEEELDGVAAILDDPMLRLFTGPGYGLETMTFARHFAAEYLLYLLLVTAVMSSVVVARHTRAEEQHGRAELLRSSVVGTHAPLTAALLHATALSLAVGVVVTATALALGGFPAAGSLLTGASVAAIGLVFAALTAVCAQLTAESRATTGLASALLGLAFLVRGIGDMAERGGSALSWFSPLGWAQQTAPFVLDRWWPATLLLLAAAVLTVLAILISTRRDLGSSLIAPRSGAGAAGRVLGTPIGMSARLLRGTMLGWGIGALAWGVVMAGSAGIMRDSMQDLPEIFAELFPPETMMESYLAFSVLTMVMVITAGAVAATQRLRAEESTGHAEQVLATGVRRTRWLGSWLLVVALGVVLVTAVTGVVAGWTAAAVLDDGAWTGRLLAASLNHLPAVLLVISVMTALFGWWPRGMGTVGWSVFGVGVLIAMIGPSLDLPDVVYGLSVFAHLAELPLEEFQPAPFWTMLVLTAAGAGLGVLGWRRREVDA